MDMIERVSQAIWDNLPVETRGNDPSVLRYPAVAAIEAMREPTEAMVIAFMDTPGMIAVEAQVRIQAARGYSMPASAMEGGSPLHQGWRAAMDAALAPAADGGAE